MKSLRIYTKTGLPGSGYVKNLYQSLQVDPAPARAIKFSRLFFLAGSFLLFAWFVYFAFCTIILPYQIEYREGAAQVVTEILLRGGNPFSLEYHPLGMNNYGIVYSLFVLPFAKLFGNTLVVHRSVTVFFLFCSLILVARTVFLLKKDILLSALSGVLIVTALAGRGGLGAFPSAMGEFLFLAAILIPFIYSFGYRSLIVSALLSVMAYYTKPYFVICVGVVAAYTFLFVSKKKGFVYGLIFLSAFGLLFLAVRYSFSLYFIDTFIGNLSNQSPSQDHLRAQLIETAAEFYPTILLGVALLFLSKLGSLQRNGFRNNPFSRLNFLQADAPLLNLPGNYFAFTFIFCFLGFVFILGRHPGSYMAYAYQIVIPPFVLWSFQMLNSKSLFSTVALCLPLANILLLNHILLNPSFLLQRDSRAWADLQNLVRSSQRVVNSPAIVSMLIEAGIPPVDSGQSEYYYEIRPYANNKLIGPSYEAIRQHGLEYRQSIRNSIRNRQFDKLILTDEHRNFLVPIDQVSEYRKVKTITIDMPQTYRTWEIAIWEPVGE